MASAQGAITAGQGGSVVPHYTGAAPESSYFAGGQGALFGPATGKISNCATGPQATTAYAQQDCDAVNFLARNPSTRPQVDVGQNDPLVTGATTILSNPGTYAGGTDGAYSACSTQTVDQTAQYTTEVCNQYTDMTQSKCQRNLVVTVTQQQAIVPSCTQGTWVGPSSDFKVLCDHQQVYGEGILHQYNFDPTAPGCVNPNYWSTTYGHPFTCLTKADLPATQGGAMYVPPYKVIPAGIFSYAFVSRDRCNVTMASSWQTVTITFCSSSQQTVINKSWDNQCAALETRAQ